MSRSGFYTWLERDPSAREQERLRIKRNIEEIFMGSRQTYGSPRVWEVLVGMGFNISEDTVARYMREMGLYAKSKRKFKAPKTTDSNHPHPVAPNKLDRNFVATKPNEVWLSDLTYIKTTEGWLYLVTVMDLYSRKIVGWNLSRSLEASGTLMALEMAVKRQKPCPGLIFHSDRGVQYACHDFRAKIAEYGFIQSMSRRGDCYDNAPMESFFHTLKTEYIHHEKFIEICQAMSGVFEWIECFYNRKRIHSSIGYKTPVAYEEEFMLAA